MSNAQPIKHVVCFSGGHSSALVAIEVVRRYGPENVVLLNHDINIRVEDFDIKRFKKEVSEFLKVPITYANHAKFDSWDQFDVVMDAKAFKVGHQANMVCTHRLKTEPFMRWLKENVDPAHTVIYYGFDSNEKGRIQRRSSILAAQGYKTDFPLALWVRTITSTSELGIEPPLAYTVFRHANCTGCIKGGRQHWYVVYATRKDIWEKAKLAEESIGYQILPDISLAELEPLFDSMLKAGVTPTERVNQTKFWVDAKKQLKTLTVCAVDDVKEDKPCECFE